MKNLSEEKMDKQTNFLQNSSFRQSLSRNPEVLKTKYIGYRLKPCRYDNRFRLFQEAQTGINITSDKAVCQRARPYLQVLILGVWIV